MSIHRQLSEQLRDAILRGNPAAGVRLPSTRALAVSLHVSRNTVMDAFEQLLAEGYLEASHGSGTYVSRSLPEHLLHAETPAKGIREQGKGDRSLSRRCAALKKLPYLVAAGEDQARVFQRGLLEWASGANAWILEDDCCSERQRCHPT